jgi:uncharacterized protein
VGAAEIAAIAAAGMAAGAINTLVGSGTLITFPVLLAFGYGLALPDDLQRVNALKNVLAGAVTGVAALVFIAVADVAWGPAALIAAGSVLGAQRAARYGRRRRRGTPRAARRCASSVPRRR